jgi:hypothetical protein
MANRFGTLNREIATDGEVVKRPYGRGLDDVETGQVATRSAPVSRRHHITVSVIIRS